MSNVNIIPSVHLRSILISSSHLCIGLAIGFFLSGYPTKILLAFLFSPIHATCANNIVHLDLIARIIYGSGMKQEGPCYEFSSVSSYFLLLLRPTYCPQHYIFNVSMLFPSVNVREKFYTYVEQEAKFLCCVF